MHWAALFLSWLFYALSCRTRIRHLRRWTAKKKAAASVQCVSRQQVVSSLSKVIVFVPSSAFSLLCFITLFNSYFECCRSSQVWSYVQQLYTLYRFIRAHIFGNFILLFCVSAVRRHRPVGLGRGGGRYRLYLILFLSLVACSWVIECNNRGGLFNKCTIFSCWTVGCWYNQLNWTTTFLVLFCFFALYQQGRKKERNFQYIPQLCLVCLLKNFQLPWDCYFCCCCLLPELDEIFPRTHSRVYNASNCI